jgi:hypothetical protein
MVEPQVQPPAQVCLDASLEPLVIAQTLLVPPSEGQLFQK